MEIPIFINKEALAEKIMSLPSGRYNYLIQRANDLNKYLFVNIFFEIGLNDELVRQLFITNSLFEGIGRTLWDHELNYRPFQEMSEQEMPEQEMPEQERQQLDMHLQQLEQLQQPQLLLRQQQIELEQAGFKPKRELFKPAFITECVKIADVNNEECVICLEEVESTKIVTFNCKHSQCVDCALRLLELNKGCAMCRCNVKTVCVKYSRRLGKKHTMSQDVVTKIRKMLGCKL
jgi:hypothetical protein